MRIKFSARAWVLSAATGLVILPSMDVESQAETQLAGSPVENSSGEPRMLVERPATRAAISTSKPARPFFPNLFSGLRTSPATTKSSPQQLDSSAVEIAAPAIDDGKSEVQRHLDELYRREGREAPVMDIGQPVSAALSESAPSVRTGSVSRTSGTAPIQQVASNPIKRFFQKISPFRRSQNPNDERPDHVEPLPAAARQEQLRLQQTPITPPVVKVAPSLIPAGEQEVVAQPAPSGLELLVPPPPAPAESLVENVEASALESVEAEFTFPSAPSAGDDSEATETADSARRLPEFLPAVALPRGNEPQKLSTELSDAPVGTEVVPGSDELLINPFPELSEADADGTAKAAKPAVAEESVEDKAANPFTGLKLEIETTAKSLEDSSVKQTAADSIPLPKFPELPAPEELTAPDDASPVGRLPEITPAELPAAKPAPASGPHADKLQQIAARSELTGLKGFCPVALRDSRELKDARPQFQAAYNGRIYNLSSAEALEKFETDPKAYAPAAGGQDVVLSSSDNTEQEGSLDHAVWYRNRLYLFSSKESRQDFVASPAKYSVDIPEVK